MVGHPPPRYTQRMIDEVRYQQIGMIGSGSVAQALALGLGPHSAAPPMLYGRSPLRLAAAVAQLDRATSTTRYDTLVGACDMIVVAVSDDAIGLVVSELASAMRDSPSPFVFHVSGGSGAAILEPLRAKGALTAAIHPVMTFIGDSPTEVRRMVGARFAITGSTDAASAHADHVVRLLGGIAVQVREEHRPLYHAALCHAANHLVTLVSGSSQILSAAGVKEPQALLAPLVRAALDNSLAHGFAALSGPLLRGDHATILNHLAALNTYSPEIAPAYRAMATATLDELERSGAPAPVSGLRDSLA